MGQIHMGRANPFRALVAGLAADEFMLLREAVDERRCRDEVGVGTLAEAAAPYRPDPKCPGFGARGAWRDGSTAAGVPRWRCRSCGRRFTSLTGTVLEHCRKPLATWVFFIRLMRHNVPVECAAELCGVTHKTALEWRHRVLATVSGYQDRIVPRDTVWVDETCINNTDPSKG
ncbi:IS1 family transposase [Collinsella sp. AM15-2]|uniref:IS1 family transposase n=1 Tax=Collinsella sp. AM15-2 TaxID=2292025 RepID=UPI0011C21EE4|nr:IS1 family transposase [Collinsella sp. AM15-2]